MGDSRISLGHSFKLEQVPNWQKAKKTWEARPSCLFWLVEKLEMKLFLDMTCYLFKDGRLVCFLLWLETMLAISNDPATID